MNAIGADQQIAVQALSAAQLDLDAVRAVLQLLQACIQPQCSGRTYHQALRQHLQQVGSMQMQIGRVPARRSRRLQSDAKDRSPAATQAHLQGLRGEAQGVEFG